MIHERVSPQTLGLARILVFGMCMATVWEFRIEDVAALPGLERHGVLRLVPNSLWELLIDAGVLGFFRWALVLLLAWLVLGLGPFRPLAGLAVVALTLYDGIARSHSPFLNHGEALMLYAAYVLALFPCNEGMSLARGAGSRSPDVQHAAPLVAIAAMTTLVYFFVAIARLDYSGPGLFTSDSMGVYILLRSLEHNRFGFTVGLEVVRGPWLDLVRAGFVVVTFMEFTSPLLLFYRPYRWAWLAVILPFHVMSLAFMNILFWQNLLIILFFLTDWPRLFSRGGGGGRATGLSSSACG